MNEFPTSESDIELINAELEAAERDGNEEE